MPYTCAHDWRITDNIQDVFHSTLNTNSTILECTTNTSLISRVHSPHCVHAYGSTSTACTARRVVVCHSSAVNAAAALTNPITNSITTHHYPYHSEVMDHRDSVQSDPNASQHRKQFKSMPTTTYARLTRMNTPQTSSPYSPHALPTLPTPPSTPLVLTSQASRNTVQSLLVGLRRAVRISPSCAF